MLTSGKRGTGMKPGSMDYHTVINRLHSGSCAVHYSLARRCCHRIGLVRVFAALIFTGSMVMSNCAHSENTWGESVDEIDKWSPSVVASGDSYVVSWQERSSSRRTVVEYFSGKDGSHRMAKADGSQIALNHIASLAAYSSLGLIDGSMSAGVVQARLGGRLEEQRLTRDSGLGVPDDRPWPNLLIDREDAILWLAIGDDQPDGGLEYVLVRYRQGHGSHVLLRLREVSAMALSPSRRIVALSGTTVPGRLRSLYVVDTVTGHVRQLLDGAGVGWFSLVSDDGGYAIVGKESRSADDRTADRVIDRQLAGGTVVRFQDDSREELNLSLDGQYPDQIVASPDGSVLGVVGWREDGGSKTRSNLWLVETRTGVERNLTPNARIAGDGAAFSPEGSYIAYGADSRLYRYDLRSRATRDVFGDRGDASWGGRSRFAWISDTDVLCFSNVGATGARGQLSLWRSLPADEVFVAGRPATWR